MAGSPSPPIVSSRDIIYHQTLSYETEVEHEYLLYFITGNPGLIGYYETFLSTLSSSLSSSCSKTRFYVLGSSLSGFFTKPSIKPGRPYGLQEQITHIEAALPLAHTHVTEYQRTRPGTRKNPLKIILIGHSVGSYIALEVIRRNRWTDPSSQQRIVGAVLLFPTVTHIAKSPSGVQLTMLCRIPHFPWIIGCLTRILAFLLPTFLLHWLVKLATSMPDQAAQTTVSFLQNPIGVWQALHMARDEMETITEDKWGHEIWGTTSESPGDEQATVGEKPAAEGPKLVFYFAQEDHWVATKTRDELIKSRGCRVATPGPEQSSWKNQMIIAEDRVPHGFCIDPDHSKLIAHKVKTWVEQMVSSQD